MVWKKVCDSTDLPEGKSLEILFDQNVIAVFRHRGELFAIDGICMHQGGPLARGKLMDGTIVCPWHGWQYDLSTGNQSATCKPMLSTYKIQEIDGLIEIDLPS
jgi:nitrite reductase (NADH) small subunit